MSTEKENEMVEETTEVTVPEEHKVAMVSCLNPTMLTSIKRSAKRNGVELVLLEDRVIHDYLEVKNKKKDGEEIANFLNDVSNRLHAEDQCIKLYTILTNGRPVEDANSFVFSRTEVVKKTTLSHSQANSLFQLLRAFGMLEFTKGTHEFKLNFTRKRQQQTIKTEVMSLFNVLNNDIERYKNAINGDENLTDKEKAEALKTLKDSITGSFNL